MKITITEQGYNIQHQQEQLVVNSQPFGGRANTIYQGEELMIKVKPSLMYFITPQFLIVKKGQTIGQITQQYFGGNFKIKFETDGREHNYLLKTSSKRFDLFDQNDNCLFLVKADFSWKHLNNSLEVSVHDLANKNSHFMELAFYTMFCIYLYQAKGSHATAS